MKRPLPSAKEAAQILAAKRTRPPRRPAPRAGVSLAPLIKALDARFGQGMDGLAVRWREIVGDPLSRTTEPVRLIRSKSGGATLEIRVDGPAAALIQHQGPQILDRANLYLGAGAVSRLRIIQGPVKPRAVSAPALRRRRSAPLDAAREAELEAGLAEAGDERLKASLRRFGRGVLRAQDPPSNAR